MLLLCTLLCAGLIEYDGKRVPVRLFVPALVVGIVLPLGGRSTAANASLARAQLFQGWARRVGVLSMLGVLCFVGFACWKYHNREADGASPLCRLRGSYPRLDRRLLMSLSASLRVWVLAWLLRRFWPRAGLPASMFVGVSTLVWILALGKACFLLKLGVRYLYGQFL